MTTVIYCRNRFQIATTDKPIPIKHDYMVDYDEYVNRIELVYEERIKDKIKHNLCEVFS